MARDPLAGAAGAVFNQVAGVIGNDVPEFRLNSSGWRTGTRILRSCAAFHFVFATRNIVTLLEFGKVRGGIRRLTDTPTLHLFCQSQFGGEGDFVA